MGWSPLHARLHQQLKASALLPQHANLVLAISGGQDSLCLGQLLLDLQRHWQWSLAIAHCHHGWLGDDTIAGQVRAIAKQWQLPFYLCQPEQILPETENAARQWRYGALTELAQQLDSQYIVTGHTQSDRAETFLYHLARGSGSTGLGSLQERRSLTEEITLVRPLLGITRQETAHFCQTFKLPVSHDPYNQQLRFKRNQVRQNILPLLRNLNSQADKHLAQTALILQDEADYLEAIASRYLQQSLNTQGNLHRLSLRPLHIALQRRIMRKFLQTLLPRMPTFPQIQAATQLIDAPNRDRLSTLPGGLSLQSQGDWIIAEHNQSR